MLLELVGKFKNWILGFYFRLVELVFLGVYWLVFVVFEVSGVGSKVVERLIDWGKIGYEFKYFIDYKEYGS